MLHQLKLTTGQHEQMIDITAQVQNVVEQEGVREGMVLVYCPHTTAAITINENADPTVVQDILMRLDELFPWKHSAYRHREGNSAAHLKASTIGLSQTIPVTAGRLLLGTWQGIYFCEFDGPRQRSFYVKVSAI
ncbi:secondary thiamine-phosphate synthase enzyme YjbQ [Syntrophomonas wolfei]|jgi:secondary thiamine-phosphate synthase enzyme|uniref:secondary thiamine-phosphate synthase enzyme YjbQ n=1 Tax=Syntrophomonas wolfei TaxID=863 RepID=UPI000773395B|nr:secondary thiamine-phosphate synthase enzyme YjbQ [Syntrophomonas wolfei]